MHGLGEGERAVFDALVGRVGVFGLEGRNAEIQSVEDDANAPDIDLEMIAATIKHLWRDVVGGATDCPFTLIGELQFGGQSKISYLDVEFAVDKDVAEFEVAVDDALSVNVLQS